MEEFWFLVAAALGIIGCTAALGTLWTVPLLMARHEQPVWSMWRLAGWFILSAGTTAAGFGGMALILNAIGTPGGGLQ